MRQINITGDSKTGKLNFLKNNGTVAVDIKQFNQYLIEVQTINSSGTGITAYRPGPINTFSTFKPNESYIALAKGSFTITLPGAAATLAESTAANVTIKGNSTAQRGKPTIFIYPFARSQPINAHNAKINLVYSPNNSNSFLRSYRPYNAGNGFDTFEPGKGYIIYATQDIVIANPDVVQPIAPPVATLPPTQTPFPASTPRPPSTPFPTNTPRPSDTPAPNPTMVPTNTPVPTNPPRPTPTPIPPNPTSTPLPPKPTSTPIPNNPIPPIDFDVTGPVSVTEGDLVTLTVSRKGGTDVGTSLSRPWNLTGPGLGLADFTLVNGTAPASLNGNVSLNRISTSPLVYSGTVSFKFGKNKIKTLNGSELVTFSLDTGTSEVINHNVKVFDKPEPVYYSLDGRNDTIEAVMLTQTLKKINTNTRVAHIDIPWSISGPGINLSDFREINDVKPAGLSGIVRLVPIDTTVNSNGGYNYSARFTIDFSKNKDKRNGGKETITLTFTPSDAPVVSKQIDIFDNPPPVQYIIDGPASAGEGETVTFTIDRVGGGQISSNRNANWTVSGNGINLADFNRINGTVPAKLSGVLNLAAKPGVFNSVGGREYRDIWTFQFAKNKDKKKGGYEDFKFTVDDAESKTASKTIRIYDKAPPEPPPPPAADYVISGTASVTEGDLVTITVTGRNLPAGVQRIPYTLSNVGIADFDPATPLQGELFFPGTGLYRTESVTWTARMKRRTPGQLAERVQWARPGLGWFGFKFNAAGRSFDVAVTALPFPPLPTAVPIPPSVNPRIVALTPAAPARPCVGTKGQCTNGTMTVSYTLGSVAGALQTSSTVYVNGSPFTSKNDSGGDTNTVRTLTLTGLTEKRNYSVKIVNGAKQVTGEPSAQIPQYV
jgi:hypothetical protein